MENYIHLFWPLLSQQHYNSEISIVIKVSKLFRFKTIEPSGVIFSTSDDWSTDRLEISLSRGGLVLTIRMDGHESVMLSGKFWEQSIDIIQAMGILFFYHVLFGETVTQNCNHFYVLYPFFHSFLSFIKKVLKKSNFQFLPRLILKDHKKTWIFLI